MTALEAVGVDAGYGDFQALFAVDLAVAEGELLALVGANGAGKSTLLSVLAGSLPVRRGTVRLGGADVTGVPDFRRVAAGIALVPEGRRLFGSLTVEENLLVGAATRRPGPWDLARVYATFPLLAERRGRGAARLSGGEQQTVAIARALMSNPRALLLDEVSLGLAPVVVEQVYAALPRIRAEGTTVVLVEQDLSRTLAVADRVLCILEGRVVLAGRTGELDRQQVVDAYFGSGYASTAEAAS